MCVFHINNVVVCIFRRAHLNDKYYAGVIFGCVPPDGGRFLIASRHYIYIYADMSNGAVLLCISLYISTEINPV